MSGYIQDIVKIAGKIIDIYEGKNHKENFTVSSFKNLKLFKKVLKYKKEGNHVKEDLIRKTDNS